MNSFILRKLAEVMELYEMGQYTYNEAYQNMHDILEVNSIDDADEVIDVLWR